MASLDWSSVLRELRAQGWTLTKNSNGHWKAVPPDPSASIVVIGESDDFRAIRNTIRDLKRSGFLWNEREPKSVREPSCPEPSDPAGPPYSNDVAPDTSVQEVMTLDAAFHRLKEVKDDYDLASMHEAELAERVANLRAQLIQASKEKDEARRRLVLAKADFDRLFDVAPGEAAE